LTIGEKGYRFFAKYPTVGPYHGDLGGEISEGDVTLLKQTDATDSPFINNDVKLWSPLWTRQSRIVDNKTPEVNLYLPDGSFKTIYKSSP
jgi:hypothetical protein